MNLFGLGVTPEEDAATLVDGFLSNKPAPSASDIAAFLRVVPSNEKDIATKLLVARGVSPALIDVAQTESLSKYWAYAAVASAAASGFHGYRRNGGSIGWAFWWFLWGTIFPVVTPVLALAQGFGQRRKD